MLPFRLLPNQVEFVLLSFEGPDLYSKAGGLGVRIANLAQTLACQGFLTHLIFIGSPDQPAREDLVGGRLRYYRWCQWISRYHPLGVYDGEEGKLGDYCLSVPPFIVEEIARPAAAENRHLVVLAEEWHTAETLICLSDQLHAAGLRQYSLLLWNANNTKGFDRIDWSRLNFVATITTVSRYMKQIMRSYGLDPLVIPNGIPSELLEPVPDAAVNQVRTELTGNNELLLLKVARYDPDKCWWSAVDAAAQLKQAGEKICFLARGGIEGYGSEVLNHARESGLTVKDIEGNPQTCEEVLRAIRSCGTADMYNLNFDLSQSILRIFYTAVDIILANSKHEPFGLVGLEAMAAGGVVFTGPTGEAYSIDRAGAIALDTEQSDEIFMALYHLRSHPERAQAVRRAAPYVAARFTWELVIEILFEKIYLAASHQEIQPSRPTRLDLADLVWEQAIYTIAQPPAILKSPVNAIEFARKPIEKILSAFPG